MEESSEDEEETEESKLHCDLCDYQAQNLDMLAKCFLK